MYTMHALILPQLGATIHSTAAVSSSVMCCSGSNDIRILLYSESSVIQTSIIRILNYLNHKITLHVTCGLCNYRTNAHTQYIQSVHFQSHACFLCLKMAECYKSKISVCMSTCTCICTMLNLHLFNFSRIWTKCLWHMTNRVRITEDSLYNDYYNH